MLDQDKKLQLLMHVMLTETIITEISLEQTKQLLLIKNKKQAGNLLLLVATKNKGIHSK
jgi:hypothetical protein